MPTTPTPHVPQSRHLARVLGYLLLVFFLLVTVGIYGGALTTNEKLADMIRMVSAPVAYGAPAATLLIVAALMSLPRLVPAKTTELRRRGEQVVWGDNGALDIRGEPAVLVGRSVHRKPSTEHSGSDYRTGFEVYWIPEGAEQFGAGAEADELDAWANDAGRQLVDFGSPRRHVRQFARTLAELGEADLYWLQHNTVRYRGRDTVDATLAEHLRNQPTESPPATAEAGLETEQTGDETAVHWIPPLEDKLWPILLTGALFAVVVCLVSVGMWGWTSRTLETIGVLVGGLSAVSLVAWIWYGLRTRTVAVAPSGITITDEIAGVWSRSQTIPAENIWEIEWVPTVRGSRARVLAVTEEGDRSLGPPVPGSRARDVRQIARHAIADDGPVKR